MKKNDTVEPNSFLDARDAWPRTDGRRDGCGVALLHRAFAEDLVRKGVPREEAPRRARVEFAGVERAKDECR